MRTSDDERYRRLGIPVAVGLSDYICPDHFYVANLEEVERWAKQQTADVLILEIEGYTTIARLQSMIICLSCDNIYQYRHPKSRHHVKHCHIVVNPKGYYSG